MGVARTFAYLAAILSVIVWNNGHVAKNSIFKKSDFPVGYYNQGNYSTQCTPLTDANPSNSALGFCEDITFWDLLDGAGNLSERRVLLSCDRGRKQWNTVMGPLIEPEPRGALYIYAPDSQPGGGANVKAQRITLKDYPAGHDFHPLGLEIYPSTSGNSSNLYVVNHARARTVIEQFLLSPSDPTVAKYIRTLSSPYFISPNALALTSPDSFYVTNDHLFTRRLPILGRFLPILESVLSIPLAFVSHITLSPPSPSTPQSTPAILSHTFIKLFIPFPNGIALSHSGTQVAIASTTLNQVNFYTRNTTTNLLVGRTHAVEVPFTPDNIMYTDSSDTLIVAGHPHFPTLTAVAANTTSLAPSWVVSITPRGEVLTEVPPGEYDVDAPVSVAEKVKASASHEVETVFQSNGEVMSSSSTGLRDGRTGALYVSGLYDEAGVIVCMPEKN